MNEEESKQYHAEYREKNRKYIRIRDIIKREQGRSVKLKEIKNNFKSYTKLFEDLLKKRELKHKEAKEFAEEKRKVRHYCQKFDKPYVDKRIGSEERLLKKRLHYQNNKKVLRLQKTIHYHLGVLPLLKDVRNNIKDYEDVISKLKMEKN